MCRQELLGETMYRILFYSETHKGNSEIQNKYSEIQFYSSEVWNNGTETGIGHSEGGAESVMEE